MNFIAFDFETANHKHAPCAIGLVVIIDNVCVSMFYSLINPEQPFSAHCTAIHGITERDIVNAPTFPEVWEAISSTIKRYPLVAHNASFDRFVLMKALDRYDIGQQKAIYYDTMRIFQSNFPDKKSDLETVCSHFGISMTQHHNALSDAKAVADILTCMCDNSLSDITPSFLEKDCGYFEIPTTGKDKKSLPYESRLPQELSSPNIKTDCAEEIVVNGSCFVITGTIDGYERAEIEHLIVTQGGVVRTSVSKVTDYLIVGKQDKSVVTDKQNAKSSKIIKAEALRELGMKIKIIDGITFIKGVLP